MLSMQSQRGLEEVAMAEILLTNGRSTLVDDGDYQMLSAFSWRDNGNGYVVTGNPGRCMHRVIMLPDPDMTVDHINHDRYDNRRYNLREATYSQNNSNVDLGRTMGFARISKGKSWEAVWKVNRKKVRASPFPCPALARVCYLENRAKPVPRPGK